mmetsp:Transcript_12536/g.28001  ORF Transcript_12536/g.28001 Transcript_12536/m.28001 type:complete len:249 (-) Transcript_12536:60-806(-)
MNRRPMLISMLLRGLCTSKLKRRLAPREHSTSSVATPEPSNETPDCAIQVHPPARVAVSKGTSFVKDTPFRSLPSALSRTRNARCSRAKVRYAGPKPSPIIMITDCGCPQGKMPRSGRIQRGHSITHDPTNPPKRKAKAAAMQATSMPESLSWYAPSPVGVFGFTASTPGLKVGELVITPSPFSSCVAPSTDGRCEMTLGRSLPYFSLWLAPNRADVRCSVCPTCRVFTVGVSDIMDMVCCVAAVMAA